ncbi:J domain-containing protein [Roseimaritima ulvae]|uniref:J domain-containing protein n=1 Tax=Roseimaritima ulvae TaxID=980254 RepID=A0A5B9R9V9_9BACT|nr:J domain-containing protein [Roseimaritima ulvae]QEG43831.1 hypothetical protein UC8_58880 [Roseimaritima ulvae]
MNAPADPNASDEPPWDRLPHDPRGFFDLQADDDVRSLKRAYNRLLRRFKPEKFPTEFQRIREAYEQLSEQLRYGTPDAANRSITVDTQNHEPTKSVTSTDTSATDTSANDVEYLDALLAALDPQLGDQQQGEPQSGESASVLELRKQLLLREHCSPREYLALALLSDLLPAAASAEPDPRSFSDWLLEGLRKHPDEAGLSELLKEYLSGDLAAEPRSQLLIQTAEVLSPSRFYLLTERVWDRLLQQVPFEQFKETLRKCQAAQGPTTTGRLVFYVHLLRAAIWKADEDWIAEIRDALEDSFFQLPPWTQYEMECLDALISYRGIRDRFTKLSDTARKIDQAIETYYSVAESEGDWAVLECQYAIAERGLFLARDFPLEDDLDEDRDNLLLVWQTITGEVEDRLGAESLELQPEQLTEPVQRLMLRMNERASRTERHSFGNMMVHAGLGVVLVTLVAAVCYLIRGVIDFSNAWILAGLADLGLALLALVVGAILGLVLAVIGAKGVTLLYSDVRMELLNLFRIQPLSVSEMAEVIAATEETTLDGQTVRYTNVVAKGILDDLAANFFSRSLQTLAMGEF